MDFFLGISSDVWGGCFSIAEVLIPGIILALFAVYYQQIRKREVKLEGAIAKVRIQAYECLVDVFGQLFITESPSLSEEETINGISQYVDYQDLNVDYSECVGTEKSFDDFYDKITDTLQNENIYLDYNTKNELERSVAVFTHCKMFLDAFCDTERHFSQPDKAQKKINFAYMMTAIMMKSQYNRAFMALEDVIGKQLRHLRVGYKKYSIRRRLLKLWERFLRLLDSQLQNQFAQSTLWRLMSPNYKIMTATLTQLPSVFNYIHVMDKYSPDTYYNMDTEKQLKVVGDFEVMMFANIHR